MATCATDGVKLWDLRKLRNFKSLAPYDAGTPTAAVAFDHSGLYLGVGGSGVLAAGDAVPPLSSCFQQRFQQKRCCSQCCSLCHT
jgi:hypothetical protein